VTLALIIHTELTTPQIEILLCEHMGYLAVLDPKVSNSSSVEYKKKVNGRQTLSIIIKQATINDLETLYRIERECFTIEAFSKQHLTHLLETSGATSLVALMDNAIAGFIVGLISGHDKEINGRIYTLDVAVKYRRKGVGLRLLDEIERVFVEKGARTCYLEVRKDNTAALELYRKRGYIEVKELKDYYKGAHGVRLKKKLAV